MPELRQDPITKRWVVIAAERNKRPQDFKVIREERKPGVCPFCEGNEKKTPPEITAYREPGTAPDEQGWWIRVVPNKFPALTYEGNLITTRDQFYTKMSGIGAHEVIIESPDHQMSLEKHSIHQLQEIFRAWRERLENLLSDSRINYVQIFKNAGARAGASLEHPHSQLIATPIIPPVVEDELEGAREYFEKEGKCLFCEINSFELSNKTRVVIENEEFCAYCPYASRFPFETWVIPKGHQASFTYLDDYLLNQLSLILKETMQKIVTSLNRPPYNLVLHTAPKGYLESPYYHWHIEILPRLTTVAGFEWGTGIYINPTAPEVAAAFLREAPQPVFERSSR